ncbi:Uncharacterized protein HZ326_16474 [Fusarium oxysporum f. sp. albedinis]|nr:Uncharacterized protein HZ326_16474 [Fusarium oxysporum f. sp. albedinis]
MPSAASQPTIAFSYVPHQKLPPYGLPLIIFGIYDRTFLLRICRLMLVMPHLLFFSCLTFLAVGYFSIYQVRTSVPLQIDVG